MVTVTVTAVEWVMAEVGSARADIHIAGSRRVTPIRRSDHRERCPLGFRSQFVYDRNERVEGHGS